MVPAAFFKQNGQLHQQWISIQMLLAHMAGVPTGQVDGSKHNGQQNISKMEETLCHHCSSQHLGPSLKMEESAIPLQQSVGM